MLKEHQVVFNKYYREDSEETQVDNQWERLAILTFKLDDVNAREKDLKRGIKKLKHTLEM